MQPLSREEWQIVWFSVRVAACATLLILPAGVVLAWLLARRQWPGKALVETIVTLPLVIPPVATGLLLRRLFGRRGPFGAVLHDAFGMDVVFTWRAVVLAMAVMSFPLLVRTMRVAIDGVDPRLEGIARTLGARDLRVFFTVTLPLARTGLLGGVVLAFARALGEFGATVLVAGNIPGRTSTLSLAIYQDIQLGNDASAFRLLGIAVALAFVAVWVSEWAMRRTAHR